jgi:hypothetical protein
LEVGTVCRTIWYGLFVPRRTASQEAVAHPLEHALAAGSAPLSAEDRAAYRDTVLFRNSPARMPTRPGFVSDYAASDGNFSHDLVETIDCYVAEPGTLWGLAVQDILTHRSPLLWRKREFVRERFSRTRLLTAVGASTRMDG